MSAVTLVKRGSEADSLGNPVAMLLSPGPGQGHDRHIYRSRSCIERTFSLLKQFRRVATRYEKAARNSLGLAMFAGMLIWFR